MTNERWRRVEDICHDALDRVSALRANSHTHTWLADGASRLGGVLTISAAVTYACESTRHQVSPDT